ncbi:CBS domain-containing protein [Gephyromycinifex aptenodytis]|uniref:CBS domain-containing protein n=1 Tax=Gephyromycinifex aptenodytis TaxID=2716227 RepID=UPI00144595BB|nr:CBS domain-containing protein [Gephyromycinifex aptenodytis]
MRISDLIRAKGSDVVTVAPDASVADLLSLLAEHGIGAVVVSADGSHIDGIVSERDVVRHLPRVGAELLASPVRDIMSADVYTCTQSSVVADLAGMMTEHRFRHVPVVDEDKKLMAIVSIGDVVKARTQMLESERDDLVGYIQQ